MPRNSRTSWTLGAALAALFALALALVLAACGGDDSDDSGEDTLTIYSGRSESLIAPILDEFSEETGIRVEARYGESAELVATIIEEGDNSPADIYFSQDAGSLGAAEDEGLLAKLPDSVLGRVEPRFRSERGAWVGASGRVRIVAYNVDNVAENELPESVFDLTDPEWEGRVGWAPTNASFQAFVTAMRASEGEDAAREWLEGMVANNPISYADNETARDGVAAGEADVALINHYYIAQAKEEEGDDYAVEAYFPEGDLGALVNVAGVAQLKSSDQPEAAKELIRFLLRPSSQRFFTETTKEYPLVSGVETDPNLVPLSDIDQPEIELGDLDDLPGTLELLEETGAL